MRKACLLLLAVAALGAGAAAADNEIVRAIGDSLTEGGAPFDEEGRRGYPTRLQPLLRLGGLKNAKVQNFGVGGEPTAAVLARIGGIAPGADIVVLLAGTNDVDAIIAGGLLVSDVIANLRIMLNFIESVGARAIVGTLPPRRPGARRDSSNATTYEVMQEIRALAHARRFEVADFWDLFPSRELSTFVRYYYPGADDVIGHPNAAGFQLMAETVAGVILEGDRQRPVDGRLIQPGPISQVNANSDYEMFLYDFDSGLQLSSATLVVNGEPIETEVFGNSRRARLFAAGDGRRRCKALLTVRANDRAEPPNELDFFVSRFTTSQNLLPGDANGDCRVDGRDLAIFGPAFGKVRIDEGYDQELDFVRNGRIDGDDFARLAANFGRGDLPGPDG